jgi:RimJ/RimL family protein N-acetyltransferase
MPKEVETRYLEMTSPAALKPAKAPPHPILLREEDKRHSAHWLRELYYKIGKQYGWRSTKTDEEWLLYFASQRRWFILYILDQPAGVVVIDPQENGNTEIHVFGLTPEFVGKGFGSEALKLGINQAWNLTRADGTTTKRVWLHTASTDHANALPNYLARGFRIFKRETKVKAAPEESRT